ncbi:leucine efflux protein LeuE [Sinosporangium siamense]|uniref:Membrane protein n=1 Tax=Sinosporangium siamense TaxID=1367973 RepID=A0A919RDK2_9ACTN|nr:leucine efflux protein LeuE [Sinosporangium siamense]GII91467.1 putative membrane protein [Sinosporangium siamense]
MFFGITDIWAYVLAAFFIILLPGPNSLLVLATAAQRGVAAGYRAAAGVFIGDIVLMFLSAAGLASVLKANPALFTILKYAGGGYLIWIGVQLIRSAWKAWRSPAATGSSPQAETAPRAEDVVTNPFRRAMVISLVNPKAILFFVAVFSQFVDPAYTAPALSFLILGVILQVFSVLYLTMLIFSGTYLAAQFRRRRKLSAGLSSGAGALFVGFGAKLATATLG